MRQASVATAIFLLFISQVAAQNVEPFYYYTPAVSRNFAPAVYFVEDSSSDKINVCIINNWQQKIKVSLYKDGMQNWYPAGLRSCIIPFNFSKAEPGKYEIRVYTGDKKYIKKITVTK